MPVLRSLSLQQRSRVDQWLCFPRRTLGIVLLVLAVNSLMVVLLYYEAPRPVTDMELQPETHARHLDSPDEGPSEVVPPSVPVIRQRSFKRAPQQLGLVHFSAYQVAPAEFRAVGLSELARHSQRTTDSCRWEYANGTATAGALEAFYPGEHHGKAYETTLLLCHLDRPVAASLGGTLSMTVNQVEMAVYSQQTGSLDWTPPTAPFLRHITYCGSPMYGAIDAMRVLEWLDFHRATHGVEYFHLYDAGGVDDQVMLSLQGYVERRAVDITDIRDTLQYETWLFTQVMVVNDCALRTRRTSKWTLMMDIDEYLHVTEVPHSLTAFLEPMETLPWISFGSLSFATDTCRAADDGREQWAIERLVFHEPAIHCRDASKYKSRELCLKWDGHRKYVINPRNVTLLQIHRIMDPFDSGLNAHTSIVRLNHFRGLGVRNRPMCTQLVAYPSPAPRGLVRDFTVARMALLARRKAR